MVRRIAIIGWSGASLIAAMLAVTPCAARKAEQRTRRDTVTLVAGRYVETYLRDVPIKLATANLDFEPAAYVSLGYNRVLMPRVRFLGRHNSVEVEAQIVKHVMGQRHVEGTVAIVGRTGEIGLIGTSSLNFALAPGFSWASRRPRFEYGPTIFIGTPRIRGLDSERFQFYLGVEAELTPTAGSRFHLIGKLHHRSGGYGLISPQRTGSNYLGVGLRYDLTHGR